MLPALVYLARGVDGGLASLRDFLESHACHPAGLDHDLVVLMKGWPDAASRGEARALITRAGASVLELPDEGFDWGAYMRAAHLLPHDVACFLNTHSRVRSAGWLRALVGPLASPAVGMVGATGSWATLRLDLSSAASATKALARRFGMIAAARFAAGTASAALRARHRADVPAFPNPHLRSNAFAVRLATFRAFAGSVAIPSTKGAAHLLESGPASVTRWMATRGLATLVAGADGAVYPPEQWCAAGTFRTPRQPNLLVSDNQTRAYEQAPPRQRAILELLTWGRLMSQPPEGEGKG